MRLTLAFLMTILLTGCGAKKIVVNNADGLLSYQVTKKIPLSAKQEHELDQDIDKLLNDTKPTGEAVIAIIDVLDLSSQDKLEVRYKELENIYVKLAHEASAILAKHLSRLDEKQQKSFFMKLEQDNKDIQKRLKKKSMERIEDRMDSLLGSVNKDQRNLMKEYEDYFHARNEMRSERREKLAAHFKKIFEEKSLQEREAQIRKAFQDYQTEALKGNKNLEMLKKLLPTLTQKQKDHFMNHMENLKELLKYYLTVQY